MSFPFTLEESGHQYLLSPHGTTNEVGISEVRKVEKDVNLSTIGVIVSLLSSVNSHSKQTDMPLPLSKHRVIATSS